MKTGSRKYRCVDCGNKQFFHAARLNRRSRPRCHACGSTFWEPASEGAHEVIAAGNTEKKIQYEKWNPKE